MSDKRSILDAEGTTAVTAGGSMATLGTIAATALLTFGLAGWSRAAAAAPCPIAGAERGIVAAVEPRLELRLTDGRRLRLAGLDPAARSPSLPDLDESARTRLDASLAGKAVTIMPLAGAPDRWGRIPAFVFAAGDPAGGISVHAIEAGLGRYLAEPAADACRDALLGAERRARDAKLGLWRDPYYGVLAVDDRSAFAERSATLVLAQGRLANVVSSPYRTTLRFAAPAGRPYTRPMLVATIAPRTMRQFEAQGVTLKALIGRNIRIRGLLDLRFGPRLELQAPDQIEVLDAADVPAPQAAAAPRAAD